MSEMGACVHRREMGEICYKPSRSKCRASTGGSASRGREGRKTFDPFQRKHFASSSLAILFISRHPLRISPSSHCIHLPASSIIHHIPSTDVCPPRTRSNPSSKVISSISLGLCTSLSLIHHSRLQLTTALALQCPTIWSHCIVRSNRPKRRSSRFPISVCFR